MVRSYALCTVSTGAEGYAPPDYYRTISSKQDAEAFINEIKANAVSDGANSIRERECYHSIDNNLGRVVIKFDLSTIRLGITTVLIKLPESKVTESATYNMQSYYVGYVNDINVLSDNSLEITYIVDWFTTSVLNTWLLQEGTLGPRVTAKQVLYRRLTDGEFKYSDEGLVPTKVSMVNHNIKAKLYNNVEIDLFEHRASVFMVYHETQTNTDHWILGCANDDPDSADLSPKVCWLAYCEAQGVSYTYDPSGLMFFGELPFNPELIVNELDPIVDRLINNLKWYVLNKVDKVGTSFSNSSYPSGYYPRYGNGASLKLNFAEEVVCTDYNLLRLVTGDGNPIWEVPKGSAFPNSYTGNNTLVTRCYIGGSSVAPYFVFTLPNKWWCNNAKTFTIAPLPRETFSDSLDVYYAQERQYSIDMRNFQSLNECVSGVIGGANQGAMISAFSRTGVRTAKQSVDKGFIGGGVAVASSLINYGYEMLYANKQATEIEDKYNRNKPDTLAMAGAFPSDIFFTQAGLYIYKYDDDTINNIKAYQSAFGYQTNRIATDVNLDSLEGYVQADVIFYNYGNQRTPNTNVIKKYIKDMFNYGITFTKVVLNG